MISPKRCYYDGVMALGKDVKASNYVRGEKECFKTKVKETSDVIYVSRVAHDYKIAYITTLEPSFTIVKLFLRLSTENCLNYLQPYLESL